MHIRSLSDREKGSKRMPQARAFLFRQAENRLFSPVGPLPEIDKKRITGVLVRQSVTGADTTYAESRETQLGLQDYGRLLYGEEEPKVELFDEGQAYPGRNASTSAKNWIASTG